MFGLTAPYTVYTLQCIIVWTSHTAGASTRHVLSLGILALNPARFKYFLCKSKKSSEPARKLKENSHQISLLPYLPPNHVQLS